MGRFFSFFLMAVVSVQLFAGKDTIYGTQRVVIKHMQNSLSYCLSLEDKLIESSSLQFAVRFEGMTESEEVLAVAAERHFTALMRDEVDKRELGSKVLVYDHASVSSSHGVIYRIDIKHPTFSDMKGVLCSIGGAIKRFSHDDGLAQEREFFRKYYRPEMTVIFIMGAQEEGIDEMLTNVYSDSLDSIPIGAGGGFPAMQCANEDHFHRLPINHVDREKISKIIHTMGKERVYKLLFKKSELERLGREVNHVHPFRFLWHVFTNDQLRHDMRKIYSSYFKWRGFLDGLCERLNREADADNLNRYARGFSREVGKSEGDILNYIRSRRFEQMVIYLMN